ADGATDTVRRARDNRHLVVESLHGAGILVCTGAAVNVDPRRAAGTRPACWTRRVRPPAFRAEGGHGMRASKTPSVPALVRGLAILERISKSRRGLTFAQLTRQFDFPKSSVHTRLLTFEREGYLRRDADTGRYIAGMKLADIASMAVDGVALREKAAPFLHALATDTAMTVHLATLDRDEVAVVEK